MDKSIILFSLKNVKTINIYLLRKKLQNIAIQINMIFILVGTKPFYL